MDASTRAKAPRFGVARVLSKKGFCSRSEAIRLVHAGRVRLNGRLVIDPEMPVASDRDVIEVDGNRIHEAQFVYLAMNKPRGLVVSASDEKGRETVFGLLRGVDVRHLSPVGRLDQASEGLLFFSNDTRWSAAITEPERHVEKRYHVQISRVPDQCELTRMKEGLEDEGEVLRVHQVDVIRTGQKNAWLEVVLREGRNRHLRRMLATLDIEVLRLIRVSIGRVELGSLAKGAWRKLEPSEVALF